MPEDPATEDAEEATPEKPKGAMRHFQDANPITTQEVKDFAIEMKNGLLNHLDDHAKEVITLGVKRGREAVVGGVASFISGLTGKKIGSACEVVKKDGKVCGRIPCPYHGGK